MKILTADAIRELEKETILKQNLGPAMLMERAARAIFHEIQKKVGECHRHFTVLCGFGNNGGDGLALARMLNEVGHETQIFLLQHDRYTSDNLLNQERLRKIGIDIHNLVDKTQLQFPPQSIIIDALFGSGLSRPLTEYYAHIIAQVNASEEKVIAIDIPSGMPASSDIDLNSSPVIKADLTYSFTCPKLSLLLPDFAAYNGRFEVLDIHLDLETLVSRPSPYFYTCSSQVKQWVSPSGKFAHKGSFGHAWIAGGKYGSIGALTLSCKAALKTGCGLVTAFSPSCGYTILQSSFPEALVLTDDQPDIIYNFPEIDSRYAALAIGMGMGTAPQTQKALQVFLENLQCISQKPSLLLDADALNIISENSNLITLIPRNCILTPHPKELMRLIGHWKNDFEKLDKVKAWCTHHQHIFVIKGAHTAVVLPNGEIHFNSTGNPGMATGGSGDVLSGIITSLLAQGYTAEKAAILGVYLHGLAGDIAASEIHEKSLTASDIIEHISHAWHRISPYANNIC
ncbi:NAD(P)H-hydrate dehydratase [Sphingobacterium sp. LRF_L2]|uniref:NAD(P)H-hydrate dehydratase n=1 Tax=Sphingobacterium sp. LRF_L2 TaxID=3369421 RepID=UPI003F5F31DD